MDLSEINKHSYEKVSCFNESCSKHWIRIKENPDANFCSIDCLRNPSCSARLANIGPQFQPQANQMYQFALSAALNAVTLYSTACSPLNHPFYGNKGSQSPLNLCTTGYDTIDSATLSPKDGRENQVIKIEEKMEIAEDTKCQAPKNLPAEPTKDAEMPINFQRRMEMEIEVNEVNTSPANPFFSINQQKYLEAPSQVRQKVAESPSQAQQKVAESPSQAAQQKVAEPPSQAQQKTGLQNQVSAKMPAPAKTVKIKCKDVTCHPGPAALKDYFAKFFDVDIGKTYPNRQVIRTHANKTTDVYFQTPEMQDIAAELSDDIQQFVIKGYGAVLDNFKVGDTCIAPYFGVFYRGIITKVKADSVKIFFMDFGNEEIIEKNEKIYVLPQIFQKLPRLANHGQWDLALSKELSEDDLIDILNNEELNTNVQQKITDGQYLIRIGDRAPNMRFVIKPEVSRDPDSEEVYEVEYH